MPASFSELNEKQVFKILPFIMNTSSQNKTLANKTKCLHNLLPVPNSEWRKLCNLTNAPALEKLLSLTDFLFSEMPTAPMFKKFKFKGVEYLLPSDKMTNCSLVEYAFADKAFVALSKLDNSPSGLKKKMEQITRITAILCRPKRTDVDLNSPEWEGDPREKFSTPKVEERVKLFNQLDVHIKQAVFMYFLAGKKYLHENFKVLFMEPPADEAKQFGKIKLNAPDFGWMGIIFQLAESGTFGPFDHVKHFFLHTACWHLAQKAYAYYESIDANN